MSQATPRAWERAKRFIEKQLKREQKWYEKPWDHHLVTQERRAARREDTPRQLLATQQYNLLGTQNTQEVARFAVKLSTIGCILILNIHRNLHPECLRILKQNDLDLYNKIVDKVWKYL